MMPKSTEPHGSRKGVMQRLVYRAPQQRPYHDVPYKAVACQCAVALVMVAIAWGWAGMPAAMSVLLSCVVSLIPALYFAFRFLRPRGSRQARQYVSNLYRAQVGKMTLTMVLFAIVFVKWPPSHPILFFSAYAVTTCVPWLTSWRVQRGHPL